MNLQYPIMNQKRTLSMMLISLMILFLMIIQLHLIKQFSCEPVPDSEYPTCFSTSSFLIETISPPDVIVPTALEECDDDYDGIVSYFNFSEKTDEILNGQSGIIVSYHETIEDAENNANAIIDLYTNTTADNQTLHVRLEDNETGCAATTTLDLIVNAIPEIIRSYSRGL